jgi:hypothetical protein
VKTGIRAGVNTSPEPVSNIIASLLEDLLVGDFDSMAHGCASRGARCCGCSPEAAELRQRPKLININAGLGVGKQHQSPH